MYYSQTATLAIYAQSEFGKGNSKTAEGMIRYGRNPIVAVVDSSEAGKTAGDVMGIDSGIPVVATIAEAIALKPDALLLGTAWTGGHLPDHWRNDIMAAIQGGLDIINGLHHFLSEDAEFAALARQHRVKLLDVRKSPTGLPVASGRAAGVAALTVLTVGSDCSSGKMTTALELMREAKRHEHRAGFIATGQTGIMIAGGGIAIDRVIGDFMAGAAETMVLDAGERFDFIFIEGQGSITHPGFSGVTLALLHGSCPRALILCHNASQTTIDELPFQIPALTTLIDLYQKAAAPVRPAPVVGIALNTSALTDADALKAIAAVEKETGLPVSDPVRFGAGKLFEAVLALREPAL